MKRAGEDECSCEKTLDEMEISLEICANQAKCFCKPSTPFTSLPLHLQTLQSIYKPALHSQTLHSIYRPTTPVTNPPLQLQTHHNSYRPTTQTNTNIKSFSSTITCFHYCHDFFPMNINAWSTCSEKDDEEESEEEDETSRMYIPRNSFLPK